MYIYIYIYIYIMFLFSVISGGAEKHSKRYEIYTIYNVEENPAGN